MEHSIAARLGRRSIGLRVSRQLRVALPRRGRRWLLVAIVGLSLLAGAWLWFRNSPFVAVQRVRINGLTEVRGGDARQIGAALTNTARGMSTLNVNTVALRAAVAAFPLVRSVEARASFPHELRIEVLEQPPVAQLAVAGAHTALAADGVVLGASFTSSSLPVISIGGIRMASLPADGRRVRQAQLRQALTALGAAPAPLLQFVQRAYWGPQGLTFALRGGVLAYFGDATRPHAKWLSLVRVLADPSSAGATYVDVRLPERPAAGFPSGVTPPDATHASEPTGVSESASSSELDADLAAALGGGSSAAAGASSGGSGASSESAGTSSEASTSSSHGANAGPSGSEASAEAGSNTEISAGTDASAAAEGSIGAPSSENPGG
jgi:cell division protein FtsQ